MSRPTLSIRIERFPVRGTFNIARGPKRGVDVVVAKITHGRISGRGEATAIYYRGESAESIAAELIQLGEAVADGLTREELPALLPAGAARNALDAALWDLEAKRTGTAVWQRIGLPQPRPLLTAYTISLGEPEVMEAAARQMARRDLLKLKLSGTDDEARVAAVRRGAPGARIIVDANEAWGGCDIERTAHLFVKYDVELIEQPVPAGEESTLDHVRSPIPLCADESVHDLASLDACLGRFQLVNVKLDKAGGLTEAMRLIAAAKHAGMDVMTGCMLSTSLGIAPAFYAAMQGRYVDLDGPLLLARDRRPGMTFEGSSVHPPPAELWG